MHRRAALGLCLALLLPAAARAAAPPAQAARADSLFQAQSWEAAGHAYRELVALEPMNGRFWYRLGYTQYQTKDYRAAVTSWTRSEAIGHNPTVMYNLGVGYALEHDADHAFEWLDKAAAAGFGNEPQLAGDTDLASLHGDRRWTRLTAAVHAAAAPCEGNPAWHQFDFWIGTWDVKDPQGHLVGHSRIDQILGQCVLLENWTGLGGGSGKSFNTYDTATKAWRQFWVDDRGSMTEFTDGRFQDGAMRFLTHSTGPDGKEILGRLSFFDLDHRRVRQWKERSTDGGATWTTDYDFTYEHPER